jgi:hypothetical protein
MKRYLGLLVVVIALGLVAMVARRTIRTAPESGARPAARPVVALDLTITSDEHITPAVAAVPKDHLVRLTVTNRHRRQVTLTLMGYQDRFGVAYVAPDSVWRGEFVADRPGEAFAWMLEGSPVGKLQVTGSHLEEGRR